ncbi:unnamed protein product [Clonostachys chloroleuca]|uniref:lytic cellulose monooxygenase (C4-dehydrogenating) n=1 Tax=Clonostachys chloroleuca TaxID=1926264 RepID=A0AA35LR80_9HYPO|nr:unnamed protein product [Clonostachys chloroleuca]
MKLQKFLGVGLSSFGTANAHYLFGLLILDGQWSKAWEYVREISPEPSLSGDIALVAPNTNPDSLDLRSGRNASLPISSVKTAVINAGSTVGFATGEPALSSTTDDLESYAGDGDWFKILSVTGRTEQSLDYSDPESAPYYDVFKSVWGTYRVGSWNFTIPATRPPGKYLLRFEHIFPHQIDAQFYVNCAHVEIVNDGGSHSPGPIVKILGVYERGQSDVYFSAYDLNFNITTFVPPAPVVWEG